MENASQQEVLNKDLTAASNGLKKLLSHSEISSNTSFKQSVEEVITHINYKILGLDYTPIKITAPLRSVPTHPINHDLRTELQEKHKAEAFGKETPNPKHEDQTSKPSPEERYNKLHDIVPWFKDLEIIKFLRLDYIKDYSEGLGNIHTLLDAYWNYAWYKEEHDNAINEDLLKKLENAANLPGIKEYDLTTRFKEEFNPLNIIHSFNLTLQDLQNNPQLAKDLKLMYLQAYNLMEIEARGTKKKIETKLGNYKKTGAY